MPSSTLNGMIAGREPLEHLRIEVAAVGRDGVPGRDDARPVDPALVDRAHERDVEHVAAGLHHQPQVAHGREAGSSVVRAFTVPCSVRYDRVVLDAVHRRRQARRAAGGADEEVQLHVHEPGQERDVAEVDLGRAGRDLGRVHPDDAVPLHHDHRRRPHLAGVDVDPAIGAKDGGVAHGAGSTTSSRSATPESGMRGWCQHSTGNDTMIIEYRRCIRLSASGGRSSSVYWSR